MLFCSCLNELLTLNVFLLTPFVLQVLISINDSSEIAVHLFRGRLKFNSSPDISMGRSSSTE